MELHYLVKLKTLLVGGMLLFLAWVGFLSFTPQAHAADLPPVDPTFKSGYGFDATVRATVLQPDGKILVGGDFTAFNQTSRLHLARLNADGTLDTSFDSGATIAFTPTVMALQPDGKILVGGNIYRPEAFSVSRLLRLNPDGSLDTTFQISGTTNRIILALALQPNGKILTGGTAGTGICPTQECRELQRLNPDGSVDSEFNSTLWGYVTALVLQPDGKILATGDIFYYGTAFRGIIRLNSNGSMDTTYKKDVGSNNRVTSIALQPDSKILVAGWFTKFGNVDRKGLARLNPDGSLDTDFNPDTQPATFPRNNGDISSGVVAVQSDGKILYAARFLPDLTGGPYDYGKFLRFNSDGSLDSSFDNSYAPNDIIYSFALQPDDKIVVGGSFSGFGGAGRNQLTRLNPDGTADTAFMPEASSGANDRIWTMQAQPDGKILIGGYFNRYSGTFRPAIARLNADGSLDNEFVPGGNPRYIVRALAVQPDGKILVGEIVGSYGSVPITYPTLTRLNRDGTLDSTFNATPQTDQQIFYYDISVIAVQPDGKILVGGYSYLMRLNPDGSRDTTFASTNYSGQNGGIVAVAVQPDGKILVGGDFYISSPGYWRNFVRLNPNGTIDSTFKYVGNYSEVVSTLAIQPDGKILMSYSGNLLRLNSDGTSDKSFTPGYLVGGVRYITVQSDGKILVGGNFTSYNDIVSRSIIRLNSDGTIDTALAAAIDGPVVGIIAIDNTTTIIAGNFTKLNNQNHGRIARVRLNALPSSVTLSSQPNPVVLGTLVTFTAQVTPVTATGTINFIFQWGNSISVPVSNGVATYITQTLDANQRQLEVKAQYSGDAIFAGSISQLYTQLICDPLVVTSRTDNGAGTTCGTFSYALRSATSGQTITFALLPYGSSVVTFSNSLNVALPVGVTLYGIPNGIMLDGNGVAGDGLHLSGNNKLQNLTIRRFAGRQLVADSGGNKLYRVNIAG